MKSVTVIGIRSEDKNISFLCKDEHGRKFTTSNRYRAENPFDHSKCVLIFPTLYSGLFK